MSTEEIPSRAKFNSENDLALVSLWCSLPLNRRSEHFWDTAAAANFAAVSPRTIRQWIDAGLISSLRIGKKHWISVDSLRTYMFYPP